MSVGDQFTKDGNDVSMATHSFKIVTARGLRRFSPEQFWRHS